MKFHWPFGLEKRADSYTDTLIALITERANNGPTPTSAATGALEAASGLVSRAFMTCEVQGSPEAQRVLTPECLGMVGRALIRHGQIVFMIRTSRGRLELLPAQTHDVFGGPERDEWEYRITLGGPSETLTFENVPSSSIIHAKYAIDPSRPWVGMSPMSIAALAGRMSAETMAALADESSMPRGAFLPLPVDGEDSTVAAMQADIKRSKGSILTVEAGDFDNPADKRMADYAVKRFGAMPPDSLVKLAQLATAEVLAACGVNPALVADTQGTAMREAYRQFLFGLVSPLGRMFAAELSEKLDEDIKIDWTELRASDIAGRARAYGVFRGGGMDVNSAALQAGLDPRHITEEPKPEPKVEETTPSPT